MALPRQAHATGGLAGYLLSTTTLTGSAPANVLLPAMAIVNSAGEELGSSARPLVVSGGGSTTSATATNTQKAATTTATDLMVANANRLSGTVYYDAAAILYLLEGSGTPSATNYTVKLGQGYFQEWTVTPGWVGPVRGVWSAATGSAAVTERTA